MAPWIVHRLPVERGTLCGWMFTALRQRPAVPFAIVEPVIHVPVKMFSPVIPGSCPDEHAAREPFWPVITVRSAIVWRRLVVSVRTNRGRSDADRYMRVAASRH